ncbi:MAG: glycoside hydrolase domain-containing protein [Spirochaetota bacterium]
MSKGMTNSTVRTAVKGSILYAACMLLCTALSAAEAKCLDRDLTFCVTFDKMSTAADAACGESASTTFKDNLEFRSVVGRDGKNAFNRKTPSELLRYDAVKNIHWKQGTVSFWIMAKNYSPGGVKSSDTEKCHKPYLNIYLSDGERWTQLFLYQYHSTPTAIFYWQNSGCGQKTYKLAGAPLNVIDRGMWFHIAATWDDEQIRIYLNGEMQKSTPLPQEAKLPDNFTPVGSKSYIAVREMLWKGNNPDFDDTGRDTVIDDIKIYSRALTESEVRSSYDDAAGGGEAGVKAERSRFDIQLSGVDDGAGDLDRLEAVIDLRPLSDEWQGRIHKGGVRAEYSLLAPSGKIAKGVWSAVPVRDMRIISNVSEAGEYALTVKVISAEGSSEEAVKKVVRPDTSWFGNTLGCDDVVPSPWTSMSIDDKNVVRVWERDYHFGYSPLPEKIVHSGASLLTKAPEIVIMTPEGKADITYTVTQRVIKNSFIGLKGTGKSKNFTITWRTKVEFDGFIRLDYTVEGSPVIDSMKIVWTVDRRYARYLMTPLLQIAGTGVYETAFPSSDRTTIQFGDKRTCLWFTSDRKGFSWSPEHDANWVYDPLVDKSIKASIDDTGGHAEVTMIHRRTTIPAGAYYHAMFIATPSRPLPERSRTYRFGGYGQYSNCDIAFVHHAGEGTESIFTLKPNAFFGDYVDHWKDQIKFQKNAKTNLAIFGASTALNNYSPEGRYFGAYWDITGNDNSFAFPVRPSYTRGSNEQQCMTINADPKTAYSDFILANIKQLFDHPKQAHAAVYYDLCVNYLSANERNGMRFQDAFGRWINTYIIVGLRDHLKRTTSYCHSRGRNTIYHAHSYFNPMIHAFADYWYPGEQYCSMMQEKNTPYYYSDFISDDVYRSELNMHTKGSAILFLGNLKRANKAYGTEEETRAMCTKLLLNDVPLTIAFEDGNVINTLWGVWMKYRMDSAKVRYYYSQKEITSSNPKVAVTYYMCSGGRTLAVIGNSSAEEQRAAIDIRGVTTASAATDEYAGRPVAVKDGILSVSIPPRHFTIIGF